MRFLAPLGFLFAAVLPVIVLLYMLRLRRVRRDVPSTLLWRRAADDMQANAPFQRLRRNLLLLLQLLVAALLVAGLARPFLRMTAPGSARTVLMLDHSASMGATDGAGGRSRLEEARARAIALVRDMAPDDQAMVVAFADKASVLCPFTGDKQRLEQALRGVEPTHLPTRADDAFALAASLATPAGARLAVFSDGAFDLSQVRLPEATACVYFAAGTGHDNAGIVALDVRRQPDAPGRFEVFTLVRNYADTPLESRLEVRNNGRMAEVRDVRAAPGAEVPLVFSSAQLAEGRVEIRLDTKDALAADDSAFAVITPPRPRRVVLVSPGNYFLERALPLASARNTELVRVDPASYAHDAAADVVVFDSHAPPPPLPPGNYLFVNAVPPLEGFTRTGEEENPVVYDWDAQHPAMRYAELSDVGIRRATVLALPAATQVLAESRTTPLMVAYSAADRNVLLWTFDLFDSNLPLRAAFPILVSNGIDWLTRDTATGENASAATGRVFQVDVPQGFTRGRMTDPTGQEWSLVPGAGGRVLFDRTTHAGFYRATLESPAGTVEADFAASLASAAESDITPRATLGFPAGEVRAQEGDGRVNREVWRWFAAAALAFILLEWLIYHRRIWV